MFEDDEPLQEEEAEVFVLQEENEEEEQEEADEDQTVQEDEDKGTERVEVDCFSRLGLDYPQILH